MSMTINDFAFNIRKLIISRNVLYDFDESIFNILDDILNEYTEDKGNIDSNIKEIKDVFRKTWNRYYNNFKILDTEVYNGVQKLIRLTEIYM